MFCSQPRSVNVAKSFTSIVLIAEHPIDSSEFVWLGPNCFIIAEIDDGQLRHPNLKLFDFLIDFQLRKISSLF